VALATVLLAVGQLAAESPEPPPFYAIQNVRVVTGSGEILDGATVVVADGLIEGVGVGVSVPGDAWLIDGEGLTLFPGLIDAMTTLGQKQEQEESGGGRGGSGGRSSGPVIRGPEDRPSTTPYLSVADELAEDARIEKWRKAGFTSTLSTPEKGFFAGQAAMINLGDREPRESVVAAGLAHRVNLSGGGGFRSYPGSLMGIIGYVKQVLSDTQHYANARAVYAGNPRGKRRLDHDRTLAPLEAAMADRTPFLLPANLPREIDRVLLLADEYDLNGVIYGGQGAYGRLDELAQAGTPVLVNLNWPEPEKDRDPEADTPIRTLYHYRAAPATPADLVEAGIPFAFYSGGLASASEIFKSVRAAIDAGLSEEDALTAMTSSPATILGVDDQLGTIERGKIANFVLASDWPWAEGVEVAAVFVDGQRFAERESDEPTEAPAQDVSGSWAITMTTPRGTQEMTAEIEMSDDGKVTGEITGRATTAIDEGRMSGDLLRFETTRSMGEQTMTASWSLTVEGESLSGTMSAGPMAMDISGDRTAVAAATEDGEGEAGADAEPDVSLEEIAEVVAAAYGPVREIGSFAITNATVWTLAGETIENGTVVVRDGRIAAVGAGVSAPAGVEVFDAEGGHLIPGIIDAHSHIGVEGGVNEGSLTVTSMVAIGDVIHPDQIAIYRALAGGVTSANLLHGSANPIGGLNQVIKLRWGRSAEELKFEGAPPGIKFALGENPKRSNFRSPMIPERYPQTRMGVMDVIRQAFLEAQEYQKEWEAYEASPGGIPPRPDRKLDALVEILEGERLVHSHCYRADEILQLLRVAEEFDFQIGTLQHVLEGYKVADEIAAHGAGASTFSDWWGYKMEAYEAIPYNAALMTERGVLTSINSDSGEEMRHLNQEAAKAVKWGGMDEAEALKLVTLNPAKQLRIDDRVGSIEVGKDADLVVYDENPLSVFAVVQQTFIDGDLYFDVGADRERQAAIDEMKARLMPEDDSGEEEEEDDTSNEESEPAPAVDWGEDDIYSCHDEVIR
jgi:imidazolonepropionase-like amidohydrolase